MPEQVLQEVKTAADGQVEGVSGSSGAPGEQGPFSKSSTVSLVTPQPAAAEQSAILARSSSKAKGWRDISSAPASRPVTRRRSRHGGEEEDRDVAVRCRRPRNTSPAPAWQT
jgi:hypothetical protein